MEDVLSCTLSFEMSSIIIYVLGGLINRTYILLCIITTNTVLIFGGSINTICRCKIIVKFVILFNEGCVVGVKLLIA